MTTLRLILAAFLIAGVSACGQTGPLYLPNKLRPTSPTTGVDQPDASSRQN
ncbi:MAG: LPS translocon maturation chaperone LptM [Pseudohongiellaceae bacterium]|jgi:predicted small lipoprotein YifL